jgi:signal transduction histidine kinase/DNA-binding response OmpR family regulator
MFFSSVEGGPSEAPRPKGRQMPTPLRVLILEDSPTEAEVMVHHLREAGYTPDWRRVETETDYLAHLDPSLDLILVDYTLPDITGPRALQLLRDRGWDVPAIVVTGTVSEQVALDCLRLGANDYILKDRLARLGVAVQSALAQRGMRKEQAAVAAELAAGTQQLDAVRAITLEIARETSLVPLLELVLRKAAELVGAVSGAVYLWDDTGQLLAPQVWFGCGDWMRHLRIKLGEGITGMVAARRQGMVVHEYRTSPYAHAVFKERTAITATLAEPLVYGDRLVGAITVNHESADRTFSAWNRETLALFAGHAAIAIENARLYEAAVRRGSQLEALLAAARSVTAGLDLQGRLDRILAEAARITGAPHVKVLLLDQAAGVLRVGALQGSAMPPDFALPVGVGSSGLVARTGQPLYMADAQNDSRSIFAERDRALGIVTYLGLPIKRGDEVLGVLTFNTTVPRQYSPEELAYLTSFADQAAIAIENARLYTAVQAHAGELEARVAERTRDLEAANLQLAAASQHKSEFLANMSHEIRTPLNSILGFTQILEEQGKGSFSAKHLRYLHNIHTSGEHLLQLITDIVDLAKVEAGKFTLAPQSLAVSAVLGAILVIARGLATKKGQRIVTEVPDDLPPLVADPVRFKQILFNLLSNAVKFTPDRGTITVRAQTVLAEAQSRRGAGERGQHLEFTVIDTGVGIRAEDLPRLFTEFTQLETTRHQWHEGTGLGLALTKRLVELHGGRVWAESEGEGKGSTLTVQLPVEGVAHGSGV